MVTDNTSTSTNSGKAPVIALLGHTGNSNLGDEAITESFIANFRARLPGVQFRIFTIVPKDVEERHGVPSYALRPSESASVTGVLYLNWQTVDKNSTKRQAPLFEREGWTYTEVEWRPTLKQRLRRLFDLVTNLPSIIANERRFDQQNAQLLKDVDLMIFTGSNQFLDNFGGPGRSLIRCCVGRNLPRKRIRR